MQIDVKGPENILDEIRWKLCDQLESHGFAKGPKIASVESGVMINYVRDDTIISVEVSQEAEGADCVLHVESETEIPELNDIWDEALISYGREMKERLKSFARNKNKIEQEL